MRCFWVEFCPYHSLEIDWTEPCTGFSRLLESPGFYFFKIPGPGKSWKLKIMVLESPGKNIVENYTSLKSPAFLALYLVS